MYKNSKIKSQRISSSAKTTEALTFRTMLEPSSNKKFTPKKM